MIGRPDSKDSNCTNANISTKHHFFLVADEDYSEKGSTDTKLDGSIISLEFPPLTKGIKIYNIPPDATPDDIKFKFSNPKIGGGKVRDMMLDRNNGIANVYFEESSGKNITYKNYCMLLL